MNSKDSPLADFNSFDEYYDHYRYLIAEDLFKNEPRPMRKKPTSKKREN